MYRILIVDDEELISEGIKSMIGELHHPLVGSVETAADCKQAMKRMEEYQPHIVFVDIRMPGISGLELIKQQRDLGTEARFVVISGYDEFEYVKTAFKYGVCDYLLKPAKLSKLKTVLEDLLSEIRESEEKKSRREREEEIQRKAAMENCFNKLFSPGEIQADRVTAVLEEFGIRFAHPCFHVVMIRCLGSVIPGKLEKMLQTAMGRVSSLQGLDGARWEVLSCFNYNSEYILIFNSPAAVHDRLIDYVERLNTEVMEEMEAQYLLTVSEEACGAAQLPVLYRQCLYAAEYRMLFGCNSVIEYRSIKSRTSDFSVLEDMLDHFQQHVDSFQQDKLSTGIDSLFSRDTLQNHPMENIQRLYRKTVSMISRMAQLNKVNIDIDFFRDFTSFETIGDIRIYLKSSLMRLIELIHTGQSEKTAIDIAKSYIRNNYARDIDLAVVSNAVSMHYNYFCKYFKENTGLNFSEYLTQVRMEEARKLLGDPTIKIYEVSARVGYDNPKRFTRLFKNYFGLLPEEYRKRNNIRTQTP